MSASQVFRGDRVGKSGGGSNGGRSVGGEMSQPEMADRLLSAQFEVGSEREFLLDSAGLPGLFNLGEKGRGDYILVDSTPDQVLSYVRQNPKMPSDLQPPSRSQSQRSINQTDLLNQVGIAQFQAGSEREWVLNQSGISGRFTLTEKGRRGTALQNATPDRILDYVRRNK